MSKREKISIRENDSAYESIVWLGIHRRYSSTIEIITKNIPTVDEIRFSYNFEHSCSISRIELISRKASVGWTNLLYYHLSKFIYLRIFQFNRHLVIILTPYCAHVCKLSLQLREKHGLCKDMFRFESQISSHEDLTRKVSSLEQVLRKFS